MHIYRLFQFGDCAVVLCMKHVEEFTDWLIILHFLSRMKLKFLISFQLIGVLITSSKQALGLILTSSAWPPAYVLLNFTHYFIALCFGTITSDQDSSLPLKKKPSFLQIIILFLFFFSGYTLYQIFNRSLYVPLIYFIKLR